MPRHLRYQSTPWSTHFITSRCTQGYSLLRPSPQANSIIAGCLAHALKRHHGEIELHHYVFMSNHLHIILSSASTQAKARFMCCFKGNVARELCRIRRWRDHLWEGRYKSYEILDEESLISAYQYIFKNSVKEGLVSHPSEWPGLHGWAQLCGRREVVGEWIDRTRWCYAQKTMKGRLKTIKDFTHTLPITLKRPPMWAHWTEDEYHSRCLQWTATALSEIQAAREAQALAEANGRMTVAERLLALLSCIGAEAVCDEPIFQPRETQRRPHPLCRARCPKRFADHMSAYRDFKAAFLEASGRLRAAIAAGVSLPSVRFPEGGAAVYIGILGT
jgi:REP element-mobilizing transposase RayT